MRTPEDFEYSAKGAYEGGEYSDAAMLYAHAAQGYSRRAEKRARIATWLAVLAIVCIVASVVLGVISALWPSQAMAHKPSKKVARNEAVMSAEDALRECRGSVNVRRPIVRFDGGGKHFRRVLVTNLDGYLEAFTWLVIVDHSNETVSIRNIGATVPQVCR